MTDRIAKITPGGTGGPALISWQQPFDSDSQIQEIAGVNHYSLIKLPFDSPATVPRKLIRSVESGLRNLATLERFFGNRFANDGPAVCEVTRPAGWDSIVSFIPARIGRYSGNLLIRGASDLAGNVTNYTAVNIVSGPCLFSSRALQASTDTSEPLTVLDPNLPLKRSIRSLTAVPELSLYEQESLRRLASLINGLFEVIPAGLPVTITSDVPRVQYYLYLLEAYNQKLITSQLLLEWFDLVDQRHALVCRRLNKLLPKELSPVVRPAVGFEVLDGYIKNQIIARQEVQLPDLIKLLADSHDIWRLMLENANPNSYRELISLSYVKEEIQSGLNSDGKNVLGVAIENPTERMTHKQSRRLASAITRRHPGLTWSSLALFPKEQLYTIGDSDLYLRDPGDTFMDPATGVSNTINSLINEVYGSTSARAAAL